MLRQAVSIRRLPLADRKRVINSSLDSIFNINELYDLTNTPSFSAMRVAYKRWFRVMYELGAVTALRSVGVAARSEFVDNEGDLEVSKDSHRELSDSEKLIIAAILFGLEDEEILFALDNRSIFFMRGSAIEFIKLIRSVVAQNVYMRTGVNTAYSQSQLAQLISDNTKIPLWKAKQVVSTETQQAFSFGMNDTFRRSGLKEHTWWSVGDERVRPAHRLNDGVTVEIGKPFPSGQLHTGDGPLSINCRCHTTAEFMNVAIVPWSGGPGGSFTSVSPPRASAVPVAIARNSNPLMGEGTMNPQELI